MNALFKTRPLDLEEARSFQRNALSLVGEAKAARRETARALWMFCAGCFAFSLCCFGGALAMFIWTVNKPPQTFFIDHDVSTGAMRLAISTRDAPTYTEATNEFWVKRYVELWEDYTWEADPRQFGIVEVMSSDDQRARYVEWHNNDPLAPVKKLGRHGYVQVDNFHAFPAGAGKAGTLIYDVQFDRTEVNNAAVGRAEHWTGEMQFQWHPELVMTDRQRMDNPGGMIVTAYYRKPPA